MVVALRVGDPSEEIVRYAADSDCDLLIASWKGRLSPGRARVVQTLLEQATYPLLFLVSRRPDAEIAVGSQPSHRGGRADETGKAHGCRAHERRGHR